jgi:hypothetical protein
MVGLNISLRFIFKPSYSPHFANTNVGSNFYRTMTTTEIITSDELTDKIESLTADNKFKTCGEFLLKAINDWPTMNLEEPKDLLDELKNEIKKPLTFDNLKMYSAGLKIDTSGKAWKMESVTSLLEMFDFDRNNTIDKEVTLDKIIERLTSHLRLGK